MIHQGGGDLSMTVRRAVPALLALALFAGAIPGGARASTCPVVDFCHEAPFFNPSTSSCDKGPFTGCSVFAVRDSMLLISDRNTNEGANTSLWIQEQGPRRIVLRFPLGACANDATHSCASSSDCAGGAACNAIDASTVLAATMTLSIRSNDTSWSGSGTPVSAHALAEDFAEGSGKTFDVPADETETRGTGPGVTYNCGTDTNVANTAADCPVQWNAGSTAIGAETDHVDFSPATSGDVSWVVTADVAAGTNRWLVKKAVEADAGRVSFFSREGAAKAGNGALAPRLVLDAGPYCGDGTLDPGEQCDDGNRDDGDCCSWNCLFESSTTTCRGSQGLCDTAEHCTGTQGNCPTDVVAASGTPCRASTGECDPAETCTGTSGACPADVLSPAGTACGGDGNPCTADTCNGSATACQHGAGNAGAVCRPGNGPCDAAETCSGSSTSCPTDALAVAGTICRPAAGVCDIAETCSGSSSACPGDTLAATGTPCRAAAGPCDVAEQCTGTAAACPADGFAAIATPCRPSTGACDIAEACSGDDAQCPPDLGEPDSDIDGRCDVVDPCTNIAGHQDFAAKSKLVLSRTGTDPVPGDEKVSLVGTFALPAAISFSSLDPVTRGGRIVLLDRDGNTIADATLPPGTYAGRGTRGWKTNSKRTSWQYLDRTTERIAGISDLKATDKSKKAPGGSVRITARGSNGAYPAEPGDEPVDAVVLLGNQDDAIDGRCGETAWSPANCAFNRKGATLTCKR